ncbi:hypothetical protein ACHAPE_003564 [Trichoderma viride]
MRIPYLKDSQFSYFDLLDLNLYQDNIRPATMDPRATSGMNPTAGVGDIKPIFDKEGAVGKQFTEQGAVGSMGQAVGGPLDKEGMVGKQFTAEGAIGGTAQSMMGGKKST